MPRPRKPARLYYRTSEDRWVILDGGREFATGALGEGARELAEEALADHINGRVEERVGPAQPHGLPIDEALARYVIDHGSEIADPERLGNAVKALASFWGGKTCDTIKGSTCCAYEKFRARPVTRIYTSSKGRKTERVFTAGPPTVRRELGVLQAAINHCVAEGLLVYAPRVTLSAKGETRDQFLTRSDAAKLLWACRKLFNRTIIRGILLALYTGTRPGTVLRTRIGIPTLDGPWIDLKKGIYHRKGKLEAVTKKRRDNCRLPERVMRHAKRWKGEFVVEWGGHQVKDIGRSLDKACELARIERITPHTFKHTAVTWFFQKGGSIEDAVGFFATSAKTLEGVYRQHHPDFQARARSIIDGK